jgi:uncharacterized membrane protein
MKFIYGSSKLEENEVKSKVLLVLSSLPVLITILLLRIVPDEIPAHYDAMGNIDRWGSKYELLILPLMIIVFQVLWMLVLHSFKKKQTTSLDEKTIAEAKQNEKVIGIVAIGTLVLFTALHFFLMISAMISVRDELQTLAFDVWMIFSIFMGVFFIVIGNVLPKTKRNSVVGLRTKWSMASDETWSKTNRFGGYAMMLIGLLVVIESFLFQEIWSVIIMLSLLIVGTIVMVVYSWKVYQSIYLSKVDKKQK